jgi:archaellum component FlaC
VSKLNKAGDFMTKIPDQLNILADNIIEAKKTASEYIRKQREEVQILDRDTGITRTEQVTPPIETPKVQ